MNCIIVILFLMMVICYDIIDSCPSNLSRNLEEDDKNGRERQLQEMSNEQTRIHQNRNLPRHERNPYMERVRNERIQRRNIRVNNRSGNVERDRPEERNVPGRMLNQHLVQPANQEHLPDFLTEDSSFLANLDEFYGRQPSTNPVMYRFPSPNP